MPEPVSEKGAPVDERAIRFQSAEFRRASQAQVVAPGGKRAAATAHGRLLLRAFAFGGLVLLLLAGTAAGVYLVSRDHKATGTSATGPQHPTSVPPSTSDSARPSASASPSASVSLPALQANQLRLAVPAWSAEAAGGGCPSGVTTFTNYQAPSSGPDSLPMEIRGSADIDVDHDGSAERVYLLRCDVGETGPEQVVAYHASTARSFDIFGTVAQTGVAFQDIQALASGAEGTVQVTVADRRTCCAETPQQAVAQVRTYSWTGATFQQTGGPTTFQADTSQSRVSLTVTVLPGTAGATSLRVQVRNDGPGAARLLLFVEVPPNPPAGGDWSRCEAPHAIMDGGSYTTCALSLPAGVSATLNLPVSVPAGNPAARVQIRTGDNHFLYAEQTLPLSTS